MARDWYVIGFVKLQRVIGFHHSANYNNKLIDVDGALRSQDVLDRRTPWIQKE